MQTQKSLGEVPTTGRTPAFLAKRYGFATLNEFIAAVPQNAIVADVGAGMSLFGHAVASARPDITWINIDPYYKNTGRSAAALADAPKNVQYLAEDITNPSAKLTQLYGKVERVYSYWMLPHLSTVGDSPAASAAGTMWDLLAPGGQLYAGPDKPYRLASLVKGKRSVTFSKKMPRNQVAQRLTNATRLPAWMKTAQGFVNRRLRPVVRPMLSLLVASQMRRARQKISAR